MVHYDAEALQRVRAAAEKTLARRNVAARPEQAALPKKRGRQRKEPAVYLEPEVPKPVAKRPALPEDLPPLTEDFGESLFDINEGKARKEHWLGMMAELEYKRKSGELVPRDAVRQATATAFSACAQSMRSIQDTLERKHGVSPEIAERVGTAIDDCLAILSEELQTMCDAKY